MMIKKILTPALVCLVFTSATVISAGELDPLLDKLVEKDVISGVDAIEIKSESEEKMKNEISQKLNNVLPLWMQTVTIGGDLRFRHEVNDDENNSYIRRRDRIRMRVSLDSKVNNKVYAYIRIASGENSDLRSTNQTLSGNFEKKSVWLDYAYFDYFPFEFLSVSAGKIKNSIWTTNDMIWDADINTEGYSVSLRKSFSSTFAADIRGGRFILDEIKDKSDPEILYSQIHFKTSNDEQNFSFESGFAYYDFKNIKGKKLLKYSSLTNSSALSSTTTYRYDYNVYSFDNEIGYTLLNPIRIPLTGLSINYLSANANYVKNLRPSTHNDGYLLGLSIGQKSVMNTGDFKLSYNYRRLSQDAFLDSYPDSDFYYGDTGIYGSKYVLTLGLAENFDITVSHINSKPIASGRKDRLTQFDVNLKF
jgi:hypothetical protein